jgi:2-polyprenyl-6-hydroxyphenyl methylase / 3-demethylubiquinone-9 3-methyltransferase
MSTPQSSVPAATSVDPNEIAKFSAMAEEWWDPTGKFAPLHRFNPVRLGFIRETVALHFGSDGRPLRPFEGLSLLDIGCGGGLLSEPMARMGFAVTGVDPSEKNIRIAQVHADRSGVEIDYRVATVETFPRSMQFDVILNMEVVEHVSDLPGFLTSCATLLKPGGIMFVATINRTLKSLALAKIAAEYILGWLPPGTHDWNRFVPPEELRALMKSAGLGVLETQGIVFDPLRWGWRRSEDTDVNYVMVAERAYGAD